MSLALIRKKGEARHALQSVRASKHVRTTPDEPPPETAASTTALRETAQWVVFRLDTGRYALPLTAVERIVRAVYVTPLALAPDIVLGAIDVAGRILPVFNIRRRLRLPERMIDPQDHFLIARTAQRTVVLVIDSAQGILERPAVAMIDAKSIGSNLGHIQGVIQAPDGLVLIHDLEHFLTPDEARALDAAMNRRGPHAS